MFSKIHGFLVLAAALVFLCAPPAAFAQDDADDDTKAAAADSMKAEPAGPVAKAPDVCEITGTVTEIQSIQKSPWSDGTPSAFAVTEVRVTVRLSSRAPHGKATAPAACASTAGKPGTYKLCSPTPIKPGDRIHATEGTLTLDPAGVGCLFDVAVLPPVSGKE